MVCAKAFHSMLTFSFQNYDPLTCVTTLTSTWISSASATQRRGRAGRCQQGVCYHLFSQVQNPNFSSIVSSNLVPKNAFKRLSISRVLENFPNRSVPRCQVFRSRLSAVVGGTMQPLSIFELSYPSRMSSIQHPSHHQNELSIMLLNRCTRFMHLIIIKILLASV